MNWLNQCHFGDARAVLRRMAADGVRVQMCVTSPPYFGLRSYLPDSHPDKAREIGLEQTPQEYVLALGRHLIGIDPNPEYKALQDARLIQWSLELMEVA
jgi:DNA modification methylase